MFALVSSKSIQASTAASRISVNDCPRNILIFWSWKNMKAMYMWKWKQTGLRPNFLLRYVDCSVWIKREEAAESSEDAAKRWTISYTTVLPGSLQLLEKWTVMLFACSCHDNALSECVLCQQVCCQQGKQNTAFFSSWLCGAVQREEFPPALYLVFIIYSFNCALYHHQASGLPSAVVQSSLGLCMS